MEGRELPLIMISRLPAVDIPSSANAASTNDKAAPQQQQTPSVVDLKKITQETLQLPNSFLHWMNAVRSRAFLFAFTTQFAIFRRITATSFRKFRVFLT